MLNQTTLRQDAETIWEDAIRHSLPRAAVKRSLSEIDFGAPDTARPAAVMGAAAVDPATAPATARPAGRLLVIAVGKAAWDMAAAAYETLGDRITTGLIITKHGHSRGPLPGFEIIEAGHPVLDENSFTGARRAIACVRDLTPQDTVLFLLSGGGSSLFELSTLPLEELQDINRQLLACGADIREINTIRKRLSLVKGGRFALACSPARVITVMLSDILGDQLDMIASGPTCVDRSTCEEALSIAKKYGLHLSPEAQRCLAVETPKTLTRVEYLTCGNVQQLCRAAVAACERLGYETVLLTDCLACHASDAGIMLADIARTHAGKGRRLAFVAGGETVVQVRGGGKGGRNQELALAAAEGISGLPNVAVFSIGSDGTDGPTDAAGGYVDGTTQTVLAAQGIRINDVLRENDAYHALERCGGLIKTGATGTNVNDLSVVLIDAR